MSPFLTLLGLFTMFLPFYFKKNCAQLAFAKTRKSLFFHTFHFAFCSISPCVLQEIALRFVGDSTAFCC